MFCVYSLASVSPLQVLEACAYVFEQTAYRGTSATVLAKELAAAGLAAKQVRFAALLLGVALPRSHLPLLLFSSLLDPGCSL